MDIFVSVYQNLIYDSTYDQRMVTGLKDFDLWSFILFNQMVVIYPNQSESTRETLPRHLSVLLPIHRPFLQVLMSVPFRQTYLALQ